MPSRAKTSVIPWENRKSAVPPKGTFVFYFPREGIPRPLVSFEFRDAVQLRMKQLGSRPPVTRRDRKGISENRFLPGDNPIELRLVGGIS